MSSFVNRAHRAGVVCLHASGSSYRQWSGLADRLTGRYAVYTPGLVGYRGGSPFDGGPVSLADEARSVHAQLGPQHEPLHLVGHSYGGAVALQFALQYPELVRSLTLYEPVMLPLLFEQAPGSEEAAEISRVGQFVVANAGGADTREAAAWRFVNYWSGPGSWDWLGAGQRERILRLMPKIAAEFAALARTRPGRAELARIEAPARLFCGTDTRTPARAVCELLGQTLPGAETHFLEGGDHMAPVTDPETVGSLVAGHLEQCALQITRIAA